MSHALASKLLERNRVGALLRIFAATPDVVEVQVASALIAAEKLLNIQINGKKVFSRVDFLVSNDQRYEDSDCMETTIRLREEVDKKFGDSPVSVLDIKQGDIYCMLLNYGIINQVEDRIPYSCIISHTSHAYITEYNIAALLGAMQEKARFAGLALKGLEEGVMSGLVVNTFSMWHNKSLMTVGGFDLRSAKPLKETICDTVTGVCAAGAGIFAGKDIKYHIAGCEEILPSIRMIRNFGPCIKPIIPKESPIWGPDFNKDPDGFKRAQAKLATKTLRQEYFASLEGETLDFIQKGIIN